LAQIYQELKADGADDLAAAKAIVEGAGGRAVTAQVMGDPCKELLSYADEHGCELVAVASDTKDYFGSLLFGSVAKGLVSGANQSVLVVKHGKALKAPIKAVAATDHSDYGSKCFALLRDMNLSGIGSYMVVTAFGSKKSMAPKFQKLIGAATDSERDILRAHLEKKSAELAHQLSSGSSDSTSLVREGRPSSVIEDAMAESGSELLILGAQGHGFLERLTLGSVSFHQVVGTPHNVLVLRA
jgi:nucleotide-binding universal stress UspA family protein